MSIRGWGERVVRVVVGGKVFVCHISIDEWFVFVGIRKCGRITEKQAFMIRRLINEHAGTDDVECWLPGARACASVVGREGKPALAPYCV